MKILNKYKSNTKYNMKKRNRLKTKHNYNF